MAPYQYEDLDLAKDAIRVVRLCRGAFYDDIQCAIDQAFLSGPDFMPYEAVSYTWGSSSKPCSILIGESKLSVTDNLYHALRFLRLEDKDRVLWIDAICINQENLRERGHQVGQMRHIYKNADRVIFWLGHSSDSLGADLLFKSALQLKDRIAESGRDWRKSLEVSEIEPAKQLLQSIQADSLTLHRESLRELLNVPWFQRVWIIQEVASARSAVIVHRSNSLSAGLFSILPTLMGIPVDEHVQAVLDIMPGPLRKSSWWQQEPDLCTLLHRFGGSRATDERDKVYALLGISSDASDPGLFPVDYKQPLNAILLRVVFFANFQSDSPFSTYGNAILPSFKYKDSKLTGILDHPRSWLFGTAVRVQAKELATLLRQRWKLDAKKVNLTHEMDFFENLGGEGIDLGEALLSIEFIDVNRIVNHTTPLKKAVGYKRNDLVDLLLRRNDIDVNLDAGSNPPLFDAVCAGNDYAAEKLLAFPGINVNRPGTSATTPFALAFLLARFVIEGEYDQERVNLYGVSRLIARLAEDGHPILPWFMSLSELSEKSRVLRIFMMLYGRPDVDKSLPVQDGNVWKRPVRVPASLADLKHEEPGIRALLDAMESTSSVDRPQQSQYVPTSRSQIIKAWYKRRVKK